MLRRTPQLAVVAALTAFGTCACVSDRVVLLPDAQGRVGKVFVQGKDSDTLIQTPYASAEVTGGGKVKQVALTQGDVQQRFSSLLSHLPPPPASYYLYFVEGSDQLTEDSGRRIPEILADIAKRPGADVVVVGHTDTVGNREDNDELSLRRATALSEQLLIMGFDPAHVSVVGRGERELLVPTPDETPEPRNRTAEINVR